MPDSIYIRDPLYGFIEVKPIEEEIINTSTFQRLNRIKQLSNTYLVYPGAAHTRFEHSLGVLNLAQKVSEKIKLNEEDTTNLRLAGLLHDIGHGPYSHSFEAIMKKINGPQFSHENTTKFLIENDKELSSILGKRKEIVLKILFDKNYVLHEIISSDFDIDKMDYFRRDSYHAGVEYGTYDFDRLLLTCTLITEEDTGKQNFGLEEKGMRAYESFRLARFNLWEQIYEHHTRLIADDMLERAITFAVEEKVISKDKLNIKETDPETFCQYFKSFDDYSLQHEILNNSKGKSKQFIEDLRNRKLFKRAYIVKADSEGIPDAHIRRKLYRAFEEGLEDIEIEISEKVKIDRDNIIIHVQNSPIKGYITSRLDPEPSQNLLIKMKNGEIHFLDQESPLKIEYKTVRRLFVFYKGTNEEGERIRKICEEKFRSKSNYYP